MTTRAWRVFDHRADLGLAVYGADCSSLFANAARALFSQITDRRRIKASQSIAVALEGADWPDLMVKWLRELLYLFNGKAMVMRSVRIDQILAFELRARLQAEAFDPRRHNVNKEIKAVTFHQIAVRQTPDGWQARIVLDL
jgi:SHS2 domain-containing protein